MGIRSNSLAVLLTLTACVHARGEKPLGEKGGLVRVDADRETLDRAHAGRRFALIVGISRFGDERWHSLRYAEKDAQDVASLLKDPNRGRFSRVVTLTTPEETTRARVVAELRALQQAVTQPNDVLLVYLSSHGTLAHDARGELRRFVVTSDARFSEVSRTALSMDELKTEVERSQSSRRVLVLASCHSGTGKSLLPPDVVAELSRLKGALRPLEETSRASMVLSASDWGEAAREDEALQNDIYTHFFVQALSGQADRNGDGAVTALEAHDFARRRTYAFTEGKQRPSAEVLEVGADPVVLAGDVTGLGQPELVSYSARLEGFTLRVDGQDRVELPGGTPVPAGRRHVQVLKGAAPLIDREVLVRPGDRIDVDALLRPEAPRARTLYLVGGAFGFVDAQSRAEVFPGSWLSGLQLELDDWPLDEFGLWLTLAGSAGARELQFRAQAPLPFTFTSVLASAAVARCWDLGRFSLSTGPSLGGLWVQRRFNVAAYSQTQSFLTVMPGWVASAVWHATSHVDVGAYGSLMLTFVRVDANDRFFGLSAGWLGVGYRFQ